jgi:hypothetical protein
LRCRRLCDFRWRASLALGHKAIGVVFEAAHANHSNDPIELKVVIDLLTLTLLTRQKAIDPRL